MKKAIILLCLLYCVANSSPALASDIESRIRAMEEALKKQEETIKDQQKIINEMKNQRETNEVTPVTEGNIKDQEVQKTAKSAGLFGGSIMMNPNISLVLNTYAYSSNLTDDEIGNRGIQGYTQEGIDRRKGFNLDAAELFIFAPVDPYFNLYATIPVKEDGAELEEAYFVTTSLPVGHQLKGGKFKSGFGRLNSQHPHAWEFVDAPLPYRVFIGDEGIIEKGVQYTYLLPLPFYTIVGMEVLQGENEILFGSDATGGPHAYTAFAKFSFDVGAHSTILFGPSVITGKTKTGTVAADTDFEGDSTLCGFEITYKWKPSPYQGFKLQGEYFYRSQSGDLTDTNLASVQRLERRQDGFYVQGVYRWSRWDFGARYDILSLFKENYTLDGSKQDLGRRPWRASVMADYNFSEFALLRIQYNHDESDVSGKVNHEFFLQAVFSIGAHGAHQF